MLNLILFLNDFWQYLFFVDFLNRHTMNQEFSLLHNFLVELLKLFQNIEQPKLIPEKHKLIQINIVIIQGKYTNNLLLHFPCHLHKYTFGLDHNVAIQM